MSYTMDGISPRSFDDTVEATVDALEAEGFGILCDIDVQETFAEKLGEEFRQYRILGACNPSLASDALDEELLLGTLLPCNVVVYETDAGDVGVSAVDPEQLVATTGNDALQEVAADVRGRFENVLDDVTDR